jgi:hypothetical protein
MKKSRDQVDFKTVVEQKNRHLIKNKSHLHSLHTGKDRSKKFARRSIPHLHDEHLLNIRISPPKFPRYLYENKSTKQKYKRNEKLKDI